MVSAYLGVDIADSVVDGDEQQQDPAIGDDEDLDNVDDINPLDAACLNQSFPAGVKTPMMIVIEGIGEDLQIAVQAELTLNNASGGIEEKSSNEEKRVG